MGVVAVGAEEIALAPVPVPGSAAVDPCSPIPVFLPVTLPAEAVGFLEGDGCSAGKMKVVSVLRIVAVQAPTVFFVMSQDDVRMKPRENPAFPVHGHHFVAVGTREDSRREGWGRYFHPLFCESSGKTGRGGIVCFARLSFVLATRDPGEGQGGR